MAYEYAVSFEIKYDDTYSARYSSLMEQLREGAQGFWAETTSMVLVRSNEKIEDFERRLYLQSKLLASKDKLLVIDHASNVAVARGPFEYPATLAGHFKAFSMK